MKIKDREVAELAKANHKWDYKKGIILSIAVAISIFVLFSAFSIAKGKIDIDSMKNMRESGNAIAVYLENAEERQYDQMVYPDYVKDYGWEYNVGDWNKEGRFLASCKVVDQTVWKKMFEPAYENIVGHYPKAENDIMLSGRLLEKIGIEDPEIGMKISVPILFKNWSVNDGEELVEEFVLSGYYTDYIDDTHYIPVAYLSEKYLDSRQVPRFPAKLAFTVKTDFFSRELLEKSLYHDIELDNAQQQFVASDSARLKSVKQFIGGYGTALFCSIILLVSVYLLIYNVFSISFAKDINNYGLLMLIGMTRKQLKQLVFRQNGIILFRGILCGGILSILGGVFIFPKLFEKLFLQQCGKLENQTVFYSNYLIWAIVISSLMLLIACNHVIGKLKNTSPLGAYKYQAKEASKKRERKSLHGASINKMAWYNLYCAKRKLIVTMIALFLGCETALLAGFITNGTNLTHEYSQNSDFEIGVQKEALQDYLFPYKNVHGLEMNQEQSLFDDSMIRKITDFSEIDKDSLNIVYGCFGTYDYSEDYIQPIEHIVYENATANNAMLIQVVDKQSIDLLEKYAKKGALDIDFETLRNGNGILVLHKHELSETLLKDAAKAKGDIAHIFSVNSEGQKGIEFFCSGYLDITDKNFPKLNMNWEEGFHYFLISEKGYQRLGFLKQIFSIRVNAKMGQETSAAQKMSELVQTENAKQEKYNVYYLTRTADKIKETENYMEAGMDVMSAFFLCLILLGVINYINIIVTNITVRKSEFTIMRCIGMTRRQLRKMLIMEGIYYLGILQVLLLSIGVLINVGVGCVIKNSLPYFTFNFPFKEWFIISVIMIIVCVYIPQIVYKKHVTKKI